MSPEEAEYFFDFGDPDDSDISNAMAAAALQRKAREGTLPPGDYACILVSVVVLYTLVGYNSMTGKYKFKRKWPANGVVVVRHAVAPRRPTAGYDLDRDASCDTLRMIGTAST